MAIFHLNAKIISRGKGQSAIAAAAYRSGERLTDEQAGQQKFYTARAERIAFTDIMAPSDAPEWTHDRNQLWNEAERAEKRKDAQLAREFEIALPHELTQVQRIGLIKDFAREQFVRHGYAVDLAIHAPDKESDERNYHAHLMVTMRTLGANGFAAKKDRSLNSDAQLDAWREQWAHLANRHLERHGHDERIDHRSLKEQGIDREAGVHLGYAATEMTQRGAQSDRMDAFRDIVARNELRFEIQAIDVEVQKLEVLQTAQQVREDRRAAKDAEGQEAWRVSVNERNPDNAKPIAKGLQVVDMATGLVTKLADFVLDFLGGGCQPAKERLSDPELEEERERRAMMAILNVRESMERGDRLSASDIRNLAPEHLENIKLRGDDYMREVIHQADKDRQRYWENEREQER